MYEVTQKIKECKRELISWNKKGYVNSARTITELKEQIQEVKK